MSSKEEPVGYPLSGPISDRIRANNVNNAQHVVERPDMEKVPNNTAHQGHRFSGR